MIKTINWGVLPELFPGVSFYNQPPKIKKCDHYGIATAIYKYLCNCKRENGSIYDSNMSSTLDMQYHHTNFVFSSVILYLINGDEVYHDGAIKVLSYYVDLPIESRRGACDFNNFPILLTYALLTQWSHERLLIGLLEKYVSKMPYYASPEDKGTYGNNFISLRALNHLLRFKLLEEQEDLELAQYLMDVTLKWQFDDGIFYDYPRHQNYSKGIPSLTYHAKITLVTLLFGLISEQNAIIDSAINGLQALIKLVACDGEAFYYGRTNNALYGYACGILAFRMASSFVKDASLAEKFKQCERDLLSFCSRHSAQDGHLYIVPSDLENVRCGFDNYMYVTVYNAFTMSTLLLSSIIKDLASPGKNDCSSEFYFLKDSGFVVKKSNKISTVFNLKGHNYYEQYILDPRFTCCSPLFLKFNGQDILPSIPFSSPLYSRENSESLGRKVWRKASEGASEFKTWGYLAHFNPLHAGFLPYLEGKNTWDMPLRVQDTTLSEFDDLIVVTARGKFMSVTRKGFLSLGLFVGDLMKKWSSTLFKKLKDLSVRETDSYFERKIIVDNKFIHFYDKIWGEKLGKVCFTLRSYSEGINELRGDKFLFDKDGHGFALLLDQGEVLRRKMNLCSSKGRTIYWDLVSKQQDLAGVTQKTIILKHTLIPFDMENDLKSSILYFNSVSKKFHDFVA